MVEMSSRKWMMLEGLFSRSIRTVRSKRCYCVQPQLEDLYDIVIVGGGLVGSTLACALGIESRLSSRRILLLEGSSSFSSVTSESPYSNRVSSVSTGAVDLFKSEWSPHHVVDYFDPTFQVTGTRLHDNIVDNDLGIWNRIKSVRAQPYSYMYVWDSDTGSRIDFSPITPTNELEDDTPAIAYVIENDLILQAVTEKNQTLLNLETRKGVRVERVSKPSVNEEWITVALEDGQEISSRLLIGADGAQSRMRDLCGFQSLKWDYPQSAVVATLEIEPVGSNTTAWQRFLPTGPIALLPLGDSHCSLVWSTSHQHAKELTKMEPILFIDALNKALFETSLPPSTASLMQAVSYWMDTVASRPPPRLLPPTITNVVVNSRAHFPLGFLHCPSYVMPRVALAGDAAHRVHPLAGLGVNLGFGDVQCLKDVVINAVSRGADIGDESALLEYQSKRLGHNVPIVFSIDGLCWLFSTQWLPLVLARSVGLHAVTSYQPLKMFFTEKAEKLN